MKSLILFLIALTIAPANARAIESAAVDPSSIAEVARIRNRFARSVLPAQRSQIKHLHAESEKYLRLLQTDGTWSDIDYADSTPSVWMASDHLQRTLIMAKSARLYRNTGHPSHVLEAKVILALKTWTDRDYRNPNWWWNEIGVPELTGEIATLMYEQLPADELSKVIEIMKRSDWRRAPWTGANLIWGVINEITRGALENNPDLVAEGYGRMYREIKIVGPTKEGIQQDNSFHQHGAQLYSGGYGLSYANDVGRFISFAWGTRFQIPPDRMDIFSSYLLDGEQWLIRGNVIDYSTIGREITRQGLVAVPEDWTMGPISPPGPAYSFGNVIAMLAAKPTPRQKEFQDFAARLQGKEGAPPFIGNKHFWCSDFISHHRRSFYTSVKMWSKRSINGELVNGEGKQSEHLSDGVNLLYLTGDEYKDIFPVWDWAKLPGTTAVQGSFEKNLMGARGTTAFTGGVSDGVFGMAAMDLVHGSLAAEKAWFFFDDSYVALGRGITDSNDTENDIVTDINQTRAVGEVFTNQSRHPLTGGRHTYPAGSIDWVYHNKVGYIIGPAYRLAISIGPQTGRWSDIGMGSTQAVTMSVFNLWIDHGSGPKDGTYQYTVIPNVSRQQLAARRKLPITQVLSNNEATQAVYNTKLKLVEAAFRKPGSLVTPVGQVGVDHPCLLMVRQVPDGWRITASNPENEPLKLRVSVNGEPVSIQLPGGDWAGSSVSIATREAR